MSETRLITCDAGDCGKRLNAISGAVPVGFLISANAETFHACNVGHLGEMIINIALSTGWTSITIFNHGGWGERG